MIWDCFKAHVTRKEPVPYYSIEFTEALERTLNYAHTGNAKVLTKGLMDPLWLSLSLVHDGMPAISQILVMTPFFGSQMDLHMVEWPTKNNEPMMASTRSQLINYGSENHQVLHIF